jgi:hypothetical protein
MLWAANRYFDADLDWTLVLILLSGNRTRLTCEIIFSVTVSALQAVSAVLLRGVHDPSSTCYTLDESDDAHEGCEYR